MQLSAADIGGGRVLRRFTMRGRAVLGGTSLTAEEIRSIPPNNLRSLIENRFLFVWPVQTGGERFVASLGGGKFDVVEGRRVNAEPLSVEDARALARGDAGNA